MLFSIIIPTYNRAELIEAAVRSVLNQSFTEFELIIVDDGSTDNTNQLIKNMSDKRIKYFWKKNEERGAARNFGVQKASGEYINFLDSDDILYSNHLMEAAKIIEEKSPKIFLFNYDLYNEPTETLSRNLLYHKIKVEKKLLSGNFISMNSVFLRKEILMDCQFKEDVKFVGGEDWLLWLKLSVRFEMKYFPITTSKVVQHNTRSVMQFNEESFIYRTNVLVDELEKDQVFFEKKAWAIKKIKAHMLSYTSLHAMINSKKYVGIKYFFKAIIVSPVELFKKRSLVILKGLLKNTISFQYVNLTDTSVVVFLFATYIKGCYHVLYL